MSLSRSFSRRRLAALTVSFVAVAGGVPSASAQSGAELPSVQRAVHVCASCHGEGGRSTKPLFPSLAGQQRDYTVRQLRDFRSQSRSETDIQAYMWGISALLDDATIDGLADYYAAQAPAPSRSRHPALEAKGKVIYQQGVPGTSVRSCASCHGEKGEGQAGFPRLAGQHAAYLERQIQAFGTPLRPHGVVMKNEVRQLTPAQRRALAAYIQSM